MAAYVPYTAFTTKEQVATIIQVDLDPVTLQPNLGGVLPYIDAAHQIVLDQCVLSGYAIVKLELIERWLAAHFYACDHRRTVQEAVSGAVSQTSDRFQVDLRLNNTVYGQQAMLLDSAGNLAAYNNALGVVKKGLPVGGPRLAWLGHRHRGGRHW